VKLGVSKRGSYNHYGALIEFKTDGIMMVLFFSREYGHLEYPQMREEEEEVKCGMGMGHGRGAEVGDSFNN